MELWGDKSGAQTTGRQLVDVAFVRLYSLTANEINIDAKALGRER